MPIERKLAAIMFTDIAGYTEQMSKDEDKAFALIQKKRELLLPLIEQYEGKLIKEIGLKELELFTTTYLYLSYKHLGKDYDVKEIHSLIKDAENIEFEVNFRLYQLLDDTSYLKTAYKQVKDNASKMDDGKKFLSYPIPKAIVEEYKRLNKDKN